MGPVAQINLGRLRFGKRPVRVTTFNTNTGILVDQIHDLV
jgi:hypothetical protein